MTPNDPESSPGDRRRCTARANRTGVRCRRPAMHGLSICQSHGGRAPQVKAAGLRRVAEAKAQRELAKRLGRRAEEFSGEVHAGQVMLRELERAVAAADTLAEMVDESGAVVHDGEVVPLVRLLLHQEREVATQAREIVRLGLSHARLSQETAQVARDAHERAIRRWSVRATREERDDLLRLVAEEIRSVSAVRNLEAP
jgi:hypothetical protein